MITIITLEQTEQWDAIVSSFSNYDVYWLSGYVKAFHLNGDGNPILIYYSSEKTKAINVVMLRDIFNDEHFRFRIPPKTYYDISTPYGYGGWIVEGEDENTESLFNEYLQWINKQGIISEFVRFHPIIENHLKCQDFYDVVQLGDVVHMELSSTNAIWSNVSSKNRNVIRKAIKNGVRIYNGRFPNLFLDFQRLYNQTMEKDNADKYYFFDEEFYRSILNDLPYNSQIFYAELDNEIISAAIIIGANGYLNYHLSGSNKEYNSYAPTNLLLYEVALWGSRNGYKTFNLGGGVGSKEDDNLFKFKKSFYTGRLHSFFIGKRIYDFEKYNELVSMRTSVDSISFFPKYRG